MKRPKSFNPAVHGKHAGVHQDQFTTPRQARIIAAAETLEQQLDVDIAWAAGIFEGEGCIIQDYSSAARSDGARYPDFKLRIVMTDKDVLDKVTGVLGGGVWGNKPQRDGNKPTWVWQVSGRVAEDVAETLRPWLCERRTAILDEKLETWRTKMAEYRASRPSTSGRRYET